MDRKYACSAALVGWAGHDSSDPAAPAPAAKPPRHTQLSSQVERLPAAPLKTRLLGCAQLCSGAGASFPWLAAGLWWGGASAGHAVAHRGGPRRRRLSGDPPGHSRGRLLYQYVFFKSYGHKLGTRGPALLCARGTGCVIRRRKLASGEHRRRQAWSCALESHPWSCTLESHPLPFQPCVSHCKIAYSRTSKRSYSRTHATALPWSVDRALARHAAFLGRALTQKQGRPTLEAVCSVPLTAHAMSSYDPVTQSKPAGAEAAREEAVGPTLGTVSASPAGAQPAKGHPLHRLLEADLRRQWQAARGRMGAGADTQAGCAACRRGLGLKGAALQSVPQQQQGLGRRH